MKAQGHFENTKEIELTLSFTMTLEEWSLLIKDMSDKWPKWDFKNKVEIMVNNAEKNIWDTDL